MPLSDPDDFKRIGIVGKDLQDLVDIAHENDMEVRPCAVELIRMAIRATKQAKTVERKLREMRPRMHS